MTQTIEEDVLAATARATPGVPGAARAPAPAHSDPTGGVATIPVLAWATGAVGQALVGEFPVQTQLRLARGGNEITR